MWGIRLLIIGLMLVRSALGLPAWAAGERNLKVASGDGDVRVALVIGNSSYPSGALANPRNDAQAIAQTLKRLGFEVQLTLDARKADLDSALKGFGNAAEKADVAALFYAGHGIQVGGLNYLVPVDAQPQSERDLKREMVKLDDVIEDMGRARVKLIFFDACRDNPLSRSFSRGASRGMAAPMETSGTLISFATKHGNTASDGAGRHSPYTETLLALLENPLDEVHALLRKVQQGVRKRTADQQEPWVYGNLDGDFYFIPPKLTPTPAIGAPDPALVELEFWRGVQLANTQEAYQGYLETYPKGLFVIPARINLDKWKNTGKAEETSPVAPTVVSHPAPEAVAQPSPPTSATVTPPPPPEVVPEPPHTPVAEAPPPAAPAVRRIVTAEVVYIGQFDIGKQGLVSGEGRLEWPNGDHYEGPIVDGIREGRGRFVWTSGIRYEGDWKQSLPHGKGRWHYANGDEYEGDVVDGEPHGQGVYRWTNGNRYEGAWVNGQKHGQGKKIFADGDMWVGEFREDEQTERGNMVFGTASSKSLSPAGRR